MGDFRYRGGMPADKIIAVVGPTASGKTALAVRLALAFDGELVSADSRQVYRGMDIGTGKERDPLLGLDGVSLLLGVPQHLIDLLEPDEVFSLADWQKRAFAVIADILARGKLPILVGGTGLYVKAVVDALDLPDAPPDLGLRRRLEHKTTAELLWELRDFNPNKAKTIDRFNKRRLIRAIEIARAAVGKGTRKNVWPHYDVLQIGINLSREELYRRIDVRVDEQMRRGLAEEVAGLVKRYGKKFPALSGIGYRELVDPVGDSVQRIKFDTHAYARRQMTWFRKDTRIRWVVDQEEAMALVETFLESS